MYAYYIPLAISYINAYVTLMHILHLHYVYAKHICIVIFY